MTDLLARLAQRPMRPFYSKVDAYHYPKAEWHMQMQARAEFDRDLALDALAAVLEKIDQYRYDCGDMVEAEFSREFLEDAHGILYELRGATSGEGAAP